MMQGRGIRGHDFTLTAALILAAALSLGSAAAQSGNERPGNSPPAAAPATQPAPAVPPSPAAAPPSPPKKEGFFDAVERWWDQSQAEFKAGFEKMKNQIDALNARSAKAAREAQDATKEATDALMKLPNTRIIEGEEICVLAPNGSPDCQSAADKICRSKGFAGGKTANVEVTRKCSARALLSRSEEDCTNETIVTKAACQ
jgi:hypothetical protein